MTEVLRFGFQKLLASRGETLRRKSPMLLLALGLSVFLPAVVGQSAPAPQAKKASPTSSIPAPVDPPPPPPAQIWLPPLQAPEHTPMVSWDGKFLTIDAENSSLADILLAIRSRTGASIDMPASTRSERIAVHLGPAPIREVLSSLLYGTDFNYVIQSSEGDETALEKVILTSREGDQNSSEDTVAGDSGTNPKMRLMPGYAAPGKRDFEVAHRKAIENSASSVEEAPAEESSAPVPDQNQVAADSAATNAPSDSHPTTSADASTSSADANTLTASDQPLSGSAAGAVAATNSSGSSSPAGSPTISQMEQNLQKMYQQRQQLQAQQSRGAQTPAP